MNNVIKINEVINFKEIESELLITELEKDNWFEIIDNDMLLIGKPVNMIKVDYEEVFG